MGSRDLSHAPFLDFSLWIFEIFPLCICVPNFKSLALLVFEIRSGVRQNLWGSHDLGHAPFPDFLCGFLRYCHYTSVYQIVSLFPYSTRFGDTLTRANYQIHCSALIKGQKPYCACAVARDLGVGDQK